MSTKLIHRVRSLSERGERITTDDCRDLFQVKDLTALAKLARLPRERRFGTRGLYRPDHVAEYAGESVELFISELDTIVPADAVELLVRCRLRGGESLALWKERCAGFRRSRLPVRVVLSAGFIARLASYEGLSHTDVITALQKECQLVITGEEAELFDADFRFAHASGVISTEEWIAVHRAAHRLGLKTIAAMTYSTVDHPAEYARHLEAIRGIQEETGGFIAFAPMAIHNRGVQDFYLAAPTAAQTIRAIAISRIFLDNIPHIIASPALVTLEIALVTLSYGADMLETVIASDDVHATEYAADGQSGLPVFDGSVAAGMKLPSIEKLRSRLAEARWLPTPVDASFAEAPQDVAV